MEKKRKGSRYVSALKQQNMKRFIVFKGLIHLKKSQICEKRPLLSDVVFKALLYLDCLSVPSHPNLLNAEVIPTKPSRVPGLSQGCGLLGAWRTAGGVLHSAHLLTFFC